MRVMRWFHVKKFECQSVASQRQDKTVQRSADAGTNRLRPWVAHKNSGFSGKETNCFPLFMIFLILWLTKLLMWKRYLCTLLYLVIISARELLSRSDTVSFSSGTLRRQDECSTWTWTVTSASSATILILVSWRKVFIWAVFIAHQRGFISWNTVI